jgi:hypothetical protein
MSRERVEIRQWNEQSSNLYGLFLKVAAPAFLKGGAYLKLSTLPLDNKT